ncbi:hypothetical protein NG829_03520 [Xanthomonas sacchari]|uniref:hypothetical protein n=1 Tax=Xanthomonas sacchari TaxID=56458 RepID=UPI00225DFD23|nr:hypothetical protein [Xanthomonas sacchari]UYK81397.1 hypothetical protein NG829_03520 [Xanthomonas sacchari]
MRKLTLLFSALLLAGTAATAVAANKKPNPADLIPGLGESVPAGVKNISLSPKFKAYKFSKDGLDYVQINSLQGEVLSVTIVTPGVQSTLPIGRAAETTMAVVNDDKQQPMGMVTAAATCPCSSQVIYDDATTRIIVIYGANGEYIQTVVIDKRTPSTPRPNT